MPKKRTDLRFERRRYGRTTFTWVEWFNGSTWVSLGDPWPCISPPIREIELFIQYRKEQEAVPHA